MNEQKRMWIKVWSIAAVIFALGCAAGVALAGIYRSQTSEPAVLQGAAVSMRDTEAYFATLHRELALDDGQASAMQAILANTREDYKAVCSDVRPRYDVVRDRARTQMRALLTTEQQERFDSIVTAEDCRCPEQKK